MLFRSSSKETKSANKLLWEGYDLFVAGKSLRALIIFRKVAKVDPKNQTAHYYCGCAFEQIGYPGFATPHYKKVAKLALQSDGRNSANYAQAIHNLGVNAAWLHQQKLAIEYALEAVEIASNISLAKDGISDKKWHKEVALAGKNLALFEAYVRYFYFNEAIDVAKRMSCLETMPSDSRALLRCLITLGGFRFSTLVNWEDDWAERLWAKAIESAGMQNSVEYKKFVDPETRSGTITLLRKKHKEKGAGANPRLL